MLKSKKIKTALTHNKFNEMRKLLGKSSEFNGLQCKDSKEGRVYVMPYWPAILRTTIPNIKFKLIPKGMIKMAKIHVDINEDLKRKLKVSAAKEGKKLREIITILVSNYVNKK